MVDVDVTLGELPAIKEEPIKIGDVQLVVSVSYKLFAYNGVMYPYGP